MYLVFIVLHFLYSFALYSTSDFQLDTQAVTRLRTLTGACQLPPVLSILEYFSYYVFYILLIHVYIIQ